MKSKIFLLTIILLISILCSGCFSETKGTYEENTSVTTSTPESSLKETESEIVKEPEFTPTPQPSAEPSKTPSSETSNEESEANTESESEDEAFVSYIVKIKYTGHYIFTEPSYDSIAKEPMPIGSFTIVEEAMDENGEKWGKLKSGAGFINLDAVLKEQSPVAIGEADREFLEKGNYADYGVETPDAVPILVQSCSDLKKITFVTLEYFDGEATAGDVLMHEEEMKSGSFMVIWADFPGDMTTYGLSLTDNDGNSCRYEIYLSGRNGTLSTNKLD